MNNVENKKRIIIAVPTHPIYLITYLFLLLPLSLVAPTVFGFINTLFGIGLGKAIFLGYIIFLSSIMLSPLNIVIKEYRTGEKRIVLTERYVYFFGFPIPIIYPVIVERKVVLAINVGGAIIPMIISTILIMKILSYSSLVLPLLIGIISTAFISYSFSRSVPGVGIVVPGFLPPLVAALTTLILVHEPTMVVPIAYVSGVLGSLLGVDLLRLIKDLRKFIYEYGASFLSIGGAGT
ncbi:MAG: DUF1614 domain-containing protein, partial [Staphylothermus sp.]|nr:DUF1614 domain-containing protein [Staphylothermus sp.]